MGQEIGSAQQEQPIVHTQQQDVRVELAKQTAHRSHTSRNRSRRITMIAIAVLAVLVACVGVFTLLPTSAPTSVGGRPTGTVAPTFSLPIYGGEGSGAIALHALRGHPVLLNFWSESCPPCRAEMPYLERIYRQYAAQHNFALLGINQADPKEDIAPFGKEYHITYPLLFDPEGKVNAAYVVTAIPTTYFIDSQGIVRSVFVTQLSPKTMRQGLASVGIRLP